MGVDSGAVLLIGGAGYVGSHAARALVQAGRRIVVLDNLSTGHREFVPPEAAFVDGSLFQSELVGDVVRKYEISAAMHFAALSLVGDSVRFPRRYYEENCGGALRLIGSLLDAGCDKIVFSSTAAVFGEPEICPIPDDAKVAPTNPYGATKAFIERLLVDYSEHGLRSVALRYFNAAGAHPSGEIGEVHSPETHLIPILLDVALGRRSEVTVFGSDYATRDGTCVRDYVHVSDLASAHIAALEHLERGGETLQLNLGTEVGTTVREAIFAASAVTARPIHHSVGARRAGDPAVLVASASGARERLAWRPERSSIETIVEDAWRFHRNRFGG